jgi:hypothetical protein
LASKAAGVPGHPNAPPDAVRRLSQSSALLPNSDPKRLRNILRELPALPSSVPVPRNDLIGDFDEIFTQILPARQYPGYRY